VLAPAGALGDDGRVILYEHASSGNCLKCRLILRALDLPYERVEVDLYRGETRTTQHFARNPDGRVPVLELDSGETIPESGAILLLLAEDTPWLPEDRLARARVHQWMFFEQNRIEADLATARFMAFAGRAERLPEAFAQRVERGRDAMAALDRGLAAGSGWLVDDGPTVADLALYGYAHCGADAGVDPRAHAHVAAWLDRVEALPGFVNDMTPVPAHARERPL
jgi:glutathione S-transferase